MSVQPASQPRLNPRLPAGESSSAQTAPPQGDGIRDTIESIILAFILAFVFRAFVVEAFIIPTGSMAPGLYGQHVKYRCRLCGYPFAVGVLEGAKGGRIACPNCGYTDDDHLRAVANQQAPPPDPGDRILVLKWPYDIGGSLLGPKRWDVVVFKAPEDGETNYIKRLLGLPGEVLEIIDGDLYTAPASAVRDDIREALSHPPPPGNPQSVRLSKDQQEALASVLRICRKPRVAQDSLWMLHYDDDYRPDLSRIRESPDFRPPVWLPRDDQQAGRSWDVSSPVVRCTPRSDRETWLDLKGRPIQDDYGYNLAAPSSSASSSIPHEVGDIRLSFVVTPLTTEGDLLLFLRKGADEFKITISADGSVKPTKKAGNLGIPIALTNARIDPLRVDVPLTIECENVDYRVALRINDQEVWATTDTDYAPDLPKLLAAPRNPPPGRPLVQLAIGSHGLPLEIRHLAVHRDVYYRSDVAIAPLPGGSGGSNPFLNYPGWGTERNPILLRSDPPDYFCCGDNSPQSLDSRLWRKACPGLAARDGDQSYQYGTVPGDQMIGRAFFVYWPGGIRFSSGTPAIIPNVGRMRIIR
jgi:signal peptidase I